MYIDIYAKSRSDPEFRNEMRKLSDAIGNSELESRKNPAAKAVFSKNVQIMLRKCGMNPGFMVPHFFPKYPKQKPLSLSARPFSYSMFNMQVGGFSVFRASRQTGKCLTSCNSVNINNLQTLEKSSLTLGELFLLCERSCKQESDLHHDH